MPRATSGAARRQSKKRWFKAARGYRGSHSKSWRKIKESVVRAGTFAYRDRRNVKRSYRALWITRINAAARMRGIRYAQFMNGLKDANIALNRKMLSEIAIHDPQVFDQLVEKAKAAHDAKAA
jgi:large subunit ribosomal protein L20